MQRTDKRLFTPGPLNTSPTVKQAMLVDLGSRDEQFIQLVAEIRDGILKVAGVSQADGYEAIPMQGSGTFGIESVLSTVIGPNDRLLILINGAYGKRMAQIAECLGLDFVTYEVSENCIHDRSRVESILGESAFTHLAVVHCETTTGILNPVGDWGAVARDHHCQFLVDGMSSFGGVPLDLRAAHVDFLMSSSNKCLQGVPGFAFVIARRELLMQIRHQPRSVSLNLRAQLEGLQSNGQFRFTPPTHTMLAFRQALRELEEEGGVEHRAARYRENHQVLCDGMGKLGFQEFVPTDLQSDIITAFRYPENSNFDFAEFYQRLSDQGMLIYPGKLSEVDCFRVGNIGHLFPDDMRDLLAAVEHALSELQVEMPVA